MVFRYAEEIFSLGMELLDSTKGRTLAGPLRFEVGVVDIIPKLMARKILEPAMAVAEGLRLVCHDGKEKQLLAELAVHRLDIVLTDSPVKTGLSIKAYSHLLGECGVSFCAISELAEKTRDNFPKSLSGMPMLLPTPMSALRGSLDQWFATIGIRPRIVGEFDDHALLKVFGQAGDGIFAIPSIIEKEVSRQYNVTLIGRSDVVRSRFYAISVERIIKHPALVAIWKGAKEFKEQWLVASQPPPALAEDKPSP
jgi:LysR family transcriptional activator of nhaA